jgi:bifunctional UDP-N-acetylglucosamine pyrophosphorylase / glucosamine-1-phosphate N-acetyltransferase
MEGLPAIGRNSRIGSGVTIKGDCRIGKSVMIGANSHIENSRVGDRCVILPGTVISDSILEQDVQLGPYCHLRNGSLVKKGAKMGNFVEMKKSVMGRGSKAMDLSYIGDAKVGRKVNIGAGTITCNYDGEKKNPTTIGDNVFIGSGTELVAPVTVHSNSYVGAGSTITEDVPRNALALARQRQKNIPGWVLRKKGKKAPPRP